MPTLEFDDTGFSQFSSDREAYDALTSDGYVHDTCGVWHRDSDGSYCIAIGGGAVFACFDTRPSRPEDSDYAAR